MALVQNERICAMDEEKFRFYVSYDDVSLEVSSVRIENDSTMSARLRVYRPDGSMAIEYIAQAGEYTTYNIPRNQRPSYETWSVSCAMLTG